MSCMLSLTCICVVMLCMFHDDCRLTWLLVMMFICINAYWWLLLHICYCFDIHVFKCILYDYYVLCMLCVFLIVSLLIDCICMYAIVCCCAVALYPLPLVIQLHSCWMQLLITHILHICYVTLLHSYLWFYHARLWLMFAVIIHFLFDLRICVCMYVMWFVLCLSYSIFSIWTINMYCSDD